jgi:hypothetical protein
MLTMIEKRGLLLWTIGLFVVNRSTGWVGRASGCLFLFIGSMMFFQNPNR